MRVGVVGCGGMGNVHTSKYALMQGVEVMAFDADQERLDAFVGKFGATPAESIEALVSACDAIDVCLPTSFHAQVAVMALEARVPTLVEKPMARSLAQCEAMVEAARSTGTLLMPAQVARWFREHRAAHEAVVAGRIGTPAAIRMRRGGLAPRGEWFLNHELSGGILLDLAVHEFDWLLWTLGPATLVHARTARLGASPVRELRGDYALSTVTFASGAVAHVESTWMDPAGFRTTIEVAGSEGILEFDSRSNPSLRVAAEASRTENTYLPDEDPYYRQLRMFIDAVAAGTPPPVTPDEGLAAVRLACAAIESAETGQPVILG